MFNNKIIYGGILILSLLSNAWFGYLLTGDEPTSKTAATSEKAQVRETIKLYSEGKVVEEWKSTSQGQWSENTYIFRVGEGAFHKEVRIHGTFSVVRENR